MHSDLFVWKHKEHVQTILKLLSSFKTTSDTMNIHILCNFKMFRTKKRHFINQEKVSAVAIPMNGVCPHPDPVNT